jgi:hypothetical protein
MSAVFLVKKRRRKCLSSVLKTYFFLPFSNLLEVRVVFLSQICNFPRGLGGGIEILNLNRFVRKEDHGSSRDVNSVSLRNIALICRPFRVGILTQG